MAELIICTSSRWLLTSFKYNPASVDKNLVEGEREGGRKGERKDEGKKDGRLVIKMM